MPNDPPSHPHDLFVRQLFSELGIVRAFLQGFLPKRVVAGLRLETLVRVPGTFTGKDERRTDLLFGVQTRQGGELRLYILIEHQSSVSRFMAVRMVGYVERIWADWRRNHGSASTLPPVIPIVLHHGGRWTAPVRLRDLVDLPPELAELETYQPELKFLLVDLAVLDDDLLQALATGGAAVMALALLLLKHVRGEGVARKLASWKKLFLEVQGACGSETVALLVNYVLRANSSVRSEVFDEILGQVSKEVVMPTAIEFREAGRQEGLQEGLQKGRQEGLQKGESRLLLRLLGRRFGALPEMIKERVEAASSEELLRWGERLMDARQLDDVFAA